MAEPHEGATALRHDFGAVHTWLQGSDKRGKGLATMSGSHFDALAGAGEPGPRAGEAVIRFVQAGKEIGRVYACCWGTYYNCDRTRVGMYAMALDKSVP